MPSSSIASTLLIISIPSLLLVFSTTNATSSSSLIDRVCSSTKEFGHIKFKSCTKLLQSEPRIVSATNLFDLSIGLMKSGISKSTHTQRHIQSLLKKSIKNPKLKEALQDCQLSYDLIIGSLKSALGEVEEREFQTATYDLLIASTDNVRMCEQAVASKGMKDEIILRGNEVVPIFGLCAFEAVGQL